MRSLTVAAAAALVLLPAAPAWAANAAPVVVDDSVDVRNVAVPNRVNALANDTDPDGDPLVYDAVVTQPVKGTAFLTTEGFLHYQPYQFETGTDSFTYRVSDGQGNTATGTVTVTLWSNLPAPTGLAISSADTTSATLIWPAATGAVRYQVFRNTFLVHTTSSTTWTDTGLTPEGNADYRIASVNGGGFGGQQSAAVYRHRQMWTPIDLAVRGAGSSTALALTWTSGENGPWNVYRDGTLVGSSATKSFTDTGLVTGQEYSYQVQTAGHTSSTSVSPASAPSSAVRGTPADSAIAQLVADRNLISTLGPITVPERAIPGGRRQDHQKGVVLQQDGADPFVVGQVNFPAVYAGAGGPAGQLGFPLADVDCTDVQAQACIQFFEGGNIVKSKYSGNPVVVLQVIEDGWAASGWGAGPLGYPVWNGRSTLRGGMGQLFFNGNVYGYVYWSEATGSHGVSDAHGFLTAWRFDHDRQDGRLGYPTSDMQCGLRADGCFQEFEGGAIYSSTATGAHEVFTPYLDVWSQLDWEEGRLGYPTRDEECGWTGHCYQQFQGGYIYWSPAGGMHAVFTPYADAKAVNPRLGAPTAGEICGLPGGGCYQQFEGGTIHWSPASGMHPVFAPYRDAWARNGAEGGRLGYPTGSEVCRLGGVGCYQHFQSGSIYWSPSTGMHAVFRPYADAWGRSGWELGRMGYPVSGEVCGLRGGGCTQHFQGGSIYWSPASGMHPIWGGIRDVWGSQGWQNGRLGYPISGEWFSGGVYRQDFQGGTITIGARGSQITYR